MDPSQEVQQDVTEPRTVRRPGTKTAILQFLILGYLIYRL